MTILYLGALEGDMSRKLTSQDINHVSLLTISNKESQYREDYVTRNFTIFSSPNISQSRRMRWTRHVARVEDRRGAHTVLMGRLEGRRPLETPTHIFEDCIKIELQEVEWGGIDRIDVAVGKDRWLALVISVVNLRVT